VGLLTAAAAAGDQQLLHHLLLPTLGQVQEKLTWTCAASASAVCPPSYLTVYQWTTPVQDSHYEQMIVAAPTPAAAAAAVARHG
jgi:hypothetical protein